MGSDVEASCSVNRKHWAISVKSLRSILWHPSGLEGEAGGLESTAVSELLEEPASGPALLAQRLPSTTSESEAFDSSSPSRTIGLSTSCQKNFKIRVDSTMEGRGRAHLDYCLNYRLMLTCCGRWSRFSPLKLPP